MKLGAYTACLHDSPSARPSRPWPVSGWTARRSTPAGSCPVHLPVDDIRTSQDARDEYLGLFGSAGVT
jgi:hypothetical protein